MPALGQRWAAACERCCAAEPSLCQRYHQEMWNIPRYIIDSEDVPPADICGSRARLVGHDQGLQRVVGSYRSVD